MTFSGIPTGAMSEDKFARLVDAFAVDPIGGAQLMDLLHESHPVYDGRGTAAVVRMRGWILLALARSGLCNQALIFVLEELDVGSDAYLVAAAARALRSHAQPNEAFAPFVARALERIRYHDEPVSFESYGEYALSSTDKSAVSELLATLAWLGSGARAVLLQLERWRAEPGLSRKLRLDLDRTLLEISKSTDSASSCCRTVPESGHVASRQSMAHRTSQCIDSIVMQDQDGRLIKFGEFFRGGPAIVVFFYTRCDNPMKCSLTVAKLARVQALLDAQGLTRRIRTAAITYDPGFDRAERLGIYGRDRAVRMDDDHRMLRAVEGNDALREHFLLGVNFVESLVNRHRVELYILDAEGNIATSLARLQWDEGQVVARAVEILKESSVSI